MPFRRRCRQGGFSYVEILVAIAIVAVVGGGIAQGLAQTSGAIGASRVDSLANNLATSQLEEAHRMPYDDVGTAGGNPPGIIAAARTETVQGIRFDIVVDVDYVDDPAQGQPRTYVNYKRVTATVTPRTASAKGVTQTTVIAPPAIGSISGKATVIATVVDALTGDPVPSVSVTIDGGPSAQRTDLTDSLGRVIFAGLEPNAIPPNDSRYEYWLAASRSGYVTHPDSAPEKARQHLAPSQTWTTTIKVFKPATVVVNLRDRDTGLAVVERSEVKLSTPEPNSVSRKEVGTTGSFTFTQISGAPIEPSRSNFRVDATAECYLTALQERPVPANYPAQTTETFTLDMQRIGSGYLEVFVRNAPSGTKLVPARVQVSGGQAGVEPRVREVDQNGYVRYCLEPSGSTEYVVSASSPGHGAGSLLATVRAGETTTVVLDLVPGDRGDIQLRAGGSNRLVRLVADVGTYDAQQLTNQFGYADFIELAGGDYTAYIATGFSDGEPVWSAGKRVVAQAERLLYYDVP